VSEPTPTRQPTQLVEDVLGKLRVTLTRIQVKGFDVLEPAEALTTLRKHNYLDLRTLDGSSLCLELMAVVRCLETLSSQHPSDQTEINETLAQAAEVLRAMTTEALQHSLEADPETALRLVRESLSGLPDEPVERILGATSGEVVTWGRVGVPWDRVRRVRVTARVLLDLRRSMSAENAVGWFQTERARLGGKTALQVLESGKAADVKTLLRLAHTPQHVL